MPTDDEVRALLRAIRDATGERRQELRERLRAEIGHRLTSFFQIGRPDGWDKDGLWCSSSHCVSYGSWQPPDRDGDSIQLIVAGGSDVPLVNEADHGLIEGY